jgi:hypothetical protein
MLETARERVALIKAGVDGKTIEHLYIKLNNFKLVGCNSRKINCWEFVGCGREIGEGSAHESEVCKVSFDTSTNGTNGGINGGRICWAISGTFNGDKVDGHYAKKLLSCRSCKFFHKVRDEEGIKFVVLKNTNESMADTACSI